MENHLNGKGAEDMKPIILTFTAYYLPGYRGGGPIRTIANMVERLSDDFEFRIITTDRDLGDEKAYPNIKVDAWNTVGKCSVFYASPATRTFSGLAKIMKETPHDLLYLNSFFSPCFTLFPVFARWLGYTPKRPLVLAPRGEFSAGALKIKSLKKQLFIRTARVIGLFSDITWHASTEAEAADIRSSFLGKNPRVRVANNIAASGDVAHKSAADAGDSEEAENDGSPRSLRVCFLSRVVAMKNLDFALEVLLNVKSDVDFKIYGPKEDAAYWDQCSTIIERMPSNIQISYCGSVAHDDVKSIIRANDVLFVPSRGENFGHIYLESLSAGVPILVSDQTPWRELESKGIGWDIPLSQPSSFAKAIENLARFTSQERLKLRLNCANYAKTMAEDPLSIELNRKVFTSALQSANP